MAAPPVDPPDIATLAALAEEVAAAGGAAIRRWFRDPVFRAPGGAEPKSDSSPVTRADREAEAAMRALLAAKRPDDAIHGEEHGWRDGSSGLVWVIDPIDGTKAFMTGRPTFASLVALCRDGVPLVGVIDQPVLGHRWVGAAGLPTRGPEGAARTRACPALDRAILNATTPDMFRGADAAAFARLAAAAWITTWGGDAYAFGLLAEGFIDLVVEADLKIHDFAALVPVIEGAGGRITDWSGAPLTLAGDGRVLAAGDPTLHAAALARLRG